MPYGVIRHSLLAVSFATASTVIFVTLLGAQSNAPSGGQGRPSLQAAVAMVPGFLGMKSAKTPDDTEVNLIWFQNKAALAAWYHSDAHQEVMHKYFGDEDLRDPLVDIADDSGPLLVIATFTRAKTPQQRLPLFSQFAIEIYQPLRGGLFVGDTLAPKGARVDGLREFSNQ